MRSTSLTVYLDRCITKKIVYPVLECSTHEVNTLHDISICDCISFNVNIRLQFLTQKTDRYQKKNIVQNPFLIIIIQQKFSYDDWSGLWWAINNFRCCCFGFLIRTSYLLQGARWTSALNFMSFASRLSPWCFVGGPILWLSTFNSTKHFGGQMLLLALKCYCSLYIELFEFCSNTAKDTTNTGVAWFDKNNVFNIIKVPLNFMKNLQHH